ncbi:MAG: tRNA (N(6)-L-threonylcarbamoyladenosine(37)-C(2))-methylthiotransferase [Candidatus Heimdallarchaeota archaeon]
MKKFFIETFGCTANISASELMSYLLVDCGYEKVQEIHLADFVVVNTCIVKAPTENKIKDLLRKMYKLHPLIIAGCLPQVLHDWCKEFIPNAALLGVDHFGDVCSAAKALESKQHIDLLDRQKPFCLEVNRDRDRDLTGIIEISKGCTGECAYCIVRIAKGTLISKTPAQIVKEAKNALDQGCKELWLTAQDTASYGIDIGSKLPEVVKEIAAIKSDFMIRVGMMNADYAITILDELKEMYSNPKVYGFVHIPLQSGSDTVLQKMKRKYTMKEYFALIEELRKVNNLTISTDIITGFPGETEEDHNLTKEAMARVQFDIINVSKYGDRKGTVASRSKEKLPTEIVKQRSTDLSTIVSEMTLNRNKQWVDWQGKALALRRENNGKTTLLRNPAYKLIEVNDSSLKLGKWYSLKIIEALKTRLVGKIIA